MSLSESKAPGRHAGESRSRFTAQDFSGGDCIENLRALGRFAPNSLGQLAWMPARLI